MVSVWGITWVNVIYGVLYPEAWPHIYRLAILFIAALPGMMRLDHLQKKSRVSYWEKTGDVPERRVIYLSDILDRLAFWWTRRRIECDFDELENDILSEHHNGHHHGNDSDRSIYPG